jgi:hypothetical protein
MTGNVVVEKARKDQLGQSLKNKEVLRRVKEERNILQTIKRRKPNWIGYIYLLKHVIEGKIEGKTEGTRRRGRRRRQLLGHLKERRR